MSTDINYIYYVCDQISDAGMITYKKMFGEYMVYINAKPVLLICDNTVYVKMLPIIEKEMNDAEIGIPYKGAKPHYILDIDNRTFSLKIVKLLEEVTPIPKPSKKK
jgi:TfoX/Sxy family transcriptional regulator of competence genes